MRRAATDPVPTTGLGPGEARRIAVAAQGLGRTRRPSVVTRRHLDQVLDSVAVLQIDSVNVLTRSHYLPVFARLGPYPQRLLDEAAHRHPRRLVEYWGHQASYTSPATHRLLGFRMAQADRESWAGMRRVAADHPGLLESVREVVAEAGPLTSAQIEQALGRRGPAERSEWGWNWTRQKMAVEYLFRAGRLASAGRTGQFERLYDLPERVIPDVLDAPGPPGEAEACRELVALAGRCLGVATEPCLRDYFRLTPEQSRRAVAELLEEGRLIPVRISGWRRPAYLDPGARIPTRIGGSALLSPFDSLIWFRRRTEELFGFRYRVEIYTPAARRVHGYYVLPYLMGDRLVARIDVKADRATGTLSVPAAWIEDEPVRGRLAAGAVAESLAADLTRLATWLGLDRVGVADRGTLSGDLHRAFGGGGPRRSG